MVNPRFVIKAVLSGQRLNINVPLTVAGTVNYIGVEAKCTSEWNDCTVVCYLYQADTGYTAQLGLIYDAERKLYYFPNAERLTLTAGEWAVWFVGVMAESGQETYRVTSDTRYFSVYPNPFASSIPPGDISLDEEALARATDAQNKANLLLDKYNAGELTGPQGEPGDPAEIGFVQASVDSTTNNPSCVVTVTENPENTYNMQFAFSGIKGAKGDTGATGPKGDTGAQGAPGRDGTDGRDGVDGETIDDYVLVQAEQPTSETNKMWLKPTASGDPIMIPSAEEFQEVSTDVAELKSELPTKRTYNLINNTRVSCIETGALRPSLPGTGGVFTGTASSGFLTAEHGIRYRNTADAVFAIGFSIESFEETGLKKGQDYTFGFDYLVRLYKTTNTATKYFSVYLWEGTDEDTIPALANITTSNAHVTYRKPLRQITHADKGQYLNGHNFCTFKFTDSTTKFALVFRFTSTGASEYSTADIIELSNMMFVEGTQEMPYAPSIYDLQNHEPIGIVERCKHNGFDQKLQQLTCKTRIGNDSQGNPIWGNEPFVLIHFSDIHGDRLCLDNVIKLSDAYSESIDDVIHTGDTVKVDSSENINFWTRTGASKILNVIGNHDTRRGSSWTGLTMAQTYQKYFAPYIANWNVICDTDTTYYYKDYTEKKIRLIVLDVMHQTADQLTWFVNTLASALTDELHVIVALHCRAHWLLTKFEVPWDDYLIAPGTNWEDTSSYTGSSYPANISNDYANALDTFIANGGNFICWIHGHTHYRLFRKLTTHTDQLDVSVANAGTAYADTSVWEREKGTQTMDDFNILAVDTTAKLLRIVKIGVNCDRYMRIADTISYNYDTGELIYSSV